MAEHSAPAPHHASIRHLATYPVKEEPGIFHERIEIEPEGLTGDRRKKRPVHLVGAEITPEDTRANVFITMPESDLVLLVGERVLLGDAVLDITELPKACPGVYATVVQSGYVGTEASMHLLD